MQDKKEFVVVSEGMGHWCRYYVSPILERAFPDRIIKWVIPRPDFHDKYYKIDNIITGLNGKEPDLVLRGQYFHQQAKGTYNCPYIGFTEEHHEDHNYYNLDRPFLANLMTRMPRVNDIMNSFYLPFAMVMPINENDPRVYKDKNRTYSVCYANSNKVPFRERVFNAIKNRVNDTITYGRCSNDTSPTGTHWLENYKLFKNSYFALVMENGNVEGYITEKIMNAFKAGCVPIYWGSNGIINEIFNRAAFINISDYNSPEDVANRIAYLYGEGREELYKMMDEPIFNENGKWNFFDWKRGDVFPECLDKIVRHIRSEYYKEEYRTSNPYANIRWVSQIGQDKYYVENICKYKENGYFVDIGASDGLNINNTVVLEQKLNWKGICVEPVMNDYNKLARNRKCIVLNDVIWSESGCSIDFTTAEFSLLSGITDKLVSWKDKIFSEKYSTDKRVTKSLTSILNENGAPVYIDYMSLDTEGSEYDILLGIDFNKYKFGYMAIHHNFEQPKKNMIKELLESKGYKLNRENGMDFDFILV